jgi:hypothetical protein
MIVVIPSCRSVRLDYLEPLIESGARFVVVDDTEGTIRVDHPSFTVYHWGDRRRMLGARDAGFPRRNGACRDFGFYVAWRESDDDEIVVALDDDCVVEDGDFAARVERSLAGGAGWCARGEGSMLNILDLYRGVDGGRIFPRGFPYSMRGGYQGWSFDPCPPQPAAFNLGLWRGVFDVNAIDKLKLERWVFDDAELRVEGAAVPPGVLVSACSMNMHFRRSLIPAVFQLPMHVHVLPDWVVDRYGDIWGGFILKTLMDLRGDRMSVGGPMIRHVKEDAFQRNIWQEHVCHLLNDEFIALLGSAAQDVRPGTYLEMMLALREELARRSHACSPLLRTYMEHLDGSLRDWLEALAA